MIRLAPVIAGALALLPALPAAAQTRAAAEPATVLDAARSDAFKKQDEFMDRIQRSDRRAIATICEKNCRGEIRGPTQPSNPFAPHATFDPETGLAMRPNGEILPPPED